MTALRKILIGLAGVLLGVASAWADKVIMKSGKIYEGRIMGETSQSVLISNAPMDPTPHFLHYRDVLTVVRDTPAQFSVTDGQRTFMAEASLAGHVFSPETITLHPAAGLHLAGGLRPHPLVELNATLDWIPTLSGQLIISDGTTSRGYESLHAYSGGFALRLYPFCRFKAWRWEPYVLGGYQWNRLVLNGSGDFLKGYSWQAGLGTLIPWRWHLYWDARFLYERTLYDRVQFLLREGSLNDSIHNPTYTFSLGLSYRH